MEKETIKISKKEYEDMVKELNRLRKEKEGIDFDIEKQIEKSLEELKQGKIIRLA